MTVHLDTHVVVWLHQAEDVRLSTSARRVIQRQELVISPMVVVELAFLHEIGRVSQGPEAVLANLGSTVGLSIATDPFEQVALAATKLTFTRDPFDRLITAQASLSKRKLVTADRTIRDSYANAVW